MGLQAETNGVLLTLFGVLLLAINKPFGQLCHGWDMRVFNRNLGSKSFPAPIILIGIVMVSIGVWLILS
jgi:hypothetical protein